MSKIMKLKLEVKESKKSPYKEIRSIYFFLKRIEIPNLKIVNIFYSFLFFCYKSIVLLFSNFWHFFIIRPIFQSMLSSSGCGLYLESKIPQVWNKPIIKIGNNIRLSGHTSFFGCPFFDKQSTLIIGDNSYIGYATTIAIGESVVIGENVKIAANCFIAGYYGHSSNPKERRENVAEKEIHDIVIGDNVWIGTNSKIMKNVKIGKNSIVAAGSVVVNDVPENVIVGGNPALILKEVNL